MVILAPETMSPKLRGAKVAEFWRHSLRGQNSHRKYQKLDTLNLFKFFFKPLSFQISIQPILPLHKEQIFCGPVPLLNQLIN